MTLKQEYFLTKNKDYERYKEITEGYRVLSSFFLVSCDSKGKSLNIVNGDLKWTEHTESQGTLVPLFDLRARSLFITD